MSYITSNTSRISYFDTVNPKVYDNYDTFANVGAFPTPADAILDRLYFAQDTQTYYRFDGASFVIAVNPVSGTVTSVTAGSASIVIGGTATNPTVNTAQNIQTTATPTFSQVIASTAAPTLATHLTRKDYVDTKVASVTAGSASIVIGGTATNPTVDTAQNIQSTATPTFTQLTINGSVLNATDASTKAYTDTKVASVTAGSSKVSIGGTATNPTVDVVEANIIHQNLSGAGTNTHTDIDSHIAGSSLKHAASVITTVPGTNNYATTSNVQGDIDALDAQIKVNTDDIGALYSITVKSVTSGDTDLLAVTGTSTDPIITNKIGAYQPLMLTAQSPLVAANQISFNGANVSSVTEINLGFNPVNEGGSYSSYVKHHYDLFKKYVPFRLKLVNASNNADYSTWTVTAYGGAGGGYYNFLVTYDASETTTTTIYTNGTNLHVQAHPMFVQQTTLDAHTTNTSNPHSVTKSQVGLGNVENTLSNFTAIVNPTVSNDNTQGYSAGSIWVNTVTDKFFVCCDAATGAAVWSSGVQYLDELLDVNTAGVATGYGIVYNGSQYVASSMTSSQDLTNNLLLNLDFNALFSGNTQVNDSSSYASVGTLVNMDGTNLVAGKLNNCLTFDGVNEYINFGVLSRMNFTINNAFTVAFWMKTSNVSSGDREIITNGEGTNGSGWFIKYTGNLQRFTALFSDITSTRSLEVQWNFGSGVSDNNWHYVVIVKRAGHTASTLDLYLDGANRNDVMNVAAATLLSTDNIQTVSIPFNIGARNGVGNNYAGSLDQISIFNFALISSQISSTIYPTSTLYNGGTGKETFGVNSITQHDHPISDIRNLQNTLNTMTTSLANSKRNQFDKGVEVLNHRYGGYFNPATNTVDANGSLTWLPQTGASTVAVDTVTSFNCCGYPRKLYRSTSSTVKYTSFTIQLSGSAWSSGNLNNVLIGFTTTKNIENIQNWITGAAKTEFPPYTTGLTATDRGFFCRFNGGNFEVLYQVATVNTTSTGSRSGSKVNSTTAVGYYLTVLYEAENGSNGLVKLLLHDSTFTLLTTGTWDLFALDGALHMINNFKSHDVVPIMNLEQRGNNYEIKVVSERELTALAFTPIATAINYFY